MFTNWFRMFICVNVLPNFQISRGGRHHTAAKKWAEQNKKEAKLISIFSYHVHNWNNCSEIMGIINKIQESFEVFFLWMKQ